MIDVVVITVLFVSLGVFWTIISTYLKVRALSNRLLAISDKEFFEAANSIMKTPDEIPDAMLVMLTHMGHEAFRSGSERDFLASVRMGRGRTRPNVDWLDDVRPEVRDLYFRAILAWFTIMVNKSPVTGYRISYEMARRRAEAGTISSNMAAEAAPLIRTFTEKDATNACAA